LTLIADLAALLAINEGVVGGSIVVADDMVVTDVACETPAAGSWPLATGLFAPGERESTRVAPGMKVDAEMPKPTNIITAPANTTVGSRLIR
jgi:hypothetical protein